MKRLDRRRRNTQKEKTPCVPNAPLSSRYDADILVKDEGRNPGGVAKHRRNSAIIEHYKDRKELILVQISSGNSALSLLELLKNFRQENPEKNWMSVTIISPETPEEIKKKLREHPNEYSIIVERDGERLITDQDMFDIAREKAVCEYENVVRVDGYHHHVLPGGYNDIWREIAHLEPDVVAFPAGSGETLFASAKLAFDESQKTGQKCPIFLGVTLPDNPLVLGQQFVEGGCRCLAHTKISTPHSPYLGGVKGLENEGIVEIIPATEWEIEQKRREMEELGIPVENASAAAFCGLDKYDIKGKKVIVVNTGKGIEADETLARTTKTDRNERESIILPAVAGFLGVLLIVVLPRVISCENKGQETVYHTPFGSISMQNLHTTSEERRAYTTLDKARAHADYNRDGEISPQEFQSVCSKIPGRNSDECAREAEEGRLTLLDFSVDELDCYNRMENSERVYGQVSISLEDSVRRDCRRKLSSGNQKRVRDMLGD
jgi:hypothetical protein